MLLLMCTKLENEETFYIVLFIRVKKLLCRGLADNFAHLAITMQVIGNLLKEDVRNLLPSQNSPFKVI